MAWPEGPLVKGTLLLARKNFAQQKGPELFERILEPLPASDQHQLRGVLLPSSWYPVDLLRRFEKQIVEALGCGDRDNLLLEIGRASATAELTEKGSQRSYVRGGDPHFLLERAPCVYASHFNVGSRTYEKTGERSAIVRTMKPFKEAEHDACLITVGWFARAIEIAGGKNPRVVETRCGARDGAVACEIHCQWE